MPETRSPNSDFNRAFGDAKKQAAGVAGEVSDAAQDIYGKLPIAPRKWPMRPQGPRGKPPVRLRRPCATQLKISPIRLSWSRSVWDGCLAECTARFDIATGLGRPDQLIRRPRKNPLLVVFCFMLAVSPSSAVL